MDDLILVRVGQYYKLKKTPSNKLIKDDIFIIDKIVNYNIRLVNVKDSAICSIYLKDFKEYFERYKLSIFKRFYNWIWSLKLKRV